MSTLIQMCLAFLQTGFFAVGGGLATLPFLLQMSTAHPDWFSPEQLANIIAVSESTPGPIGINMATYIGFETAGFPGAFLATFFLVLPSFIIIVLVSSAMKRFKNSPLVQGALGGLRPTVTGLIAAAGFTVFQMSILNGKSEAGFQLIPFVMFVIMLALTQYKKTKSIHPILYIATGAILGIVLGL